MAKNFKKIYPDYFRDFKCIGGACSDSCCIGWDIDIDKLTFKKYFKVEDSEMKKMFQKNVQNNEYCSSDDIDYGKVKLKQDKRCPFLDGENYCVIHTNLGEDYLSNVCTTFPRLTNKVDGVYEMSLDVSCPEAARLILLNEEGITFTEAREPLGKHIVSNEIDTKNLKIEYFNDVRELSIRILKNRKYDLRQRMYILGDFINRLEDEIEENPQKVQLFIRNYDMEQALEEYEFNSMNYLMQIDFLIKMVELLNAPKEAMTEQFKSYDREMKAGFTLENENILMERGKEFIDAFEEYNSKYIEKNSYLIENYLVNFVYSNMFPFNEVLSLFDSYMMLLIRFSFMRFYLVGRYLNNKNESKEKMVEFIQAYAKTIEHHKRYQMKALNHLKLKEFDNLEFAKILV